MQLGPARISMLLIGLDPGGPFAMGSNLDTHIRHVTAVLGPTNTGKTHLAIERMLGHASGMIGLPLRR
jgi:hypothetical protein